MNRRSNLGAFTFGQQSGGFGNIITDPIVPAVSGAQFLKMIGVAALTLWLVRKAFK